MQDIQLTKHFKLSEFTRSNTAKKYGIDNTPSLEVISNLQYLCREILEPLRECMNEPIVISSGYRCPKLNSHPDVKGKPTSQHLTGEAADIHLPSIEDGRRYMLFILNNCHFHQIIWEHDTHGNYWIHVSIKQKGINKQEYIPNLLKM